MTGHVSEIFDFEGAAPVKGFVNVLGFYHGMTFDNVGVTDKALLKNQSPNNGYMKAGAGHDVAFTYDGGGNLFHSSGETFSLKVGTFAAAWENGEVVTFSAYKNGALSGTQVVTLNQAKTVIHFNAGFQHIDQVTLSAIDGVQAPNSLGGKQLAMDTVRVIWDGGIPASGAELYHHDASAYHAAHAGDFLL